MKMQSLMKRFVICLLVSVIGFTLMAGFVGQVQAEKPRYGCVLKFGFINGPNAVGWPSNVAGTPAVLALAPCLETLLGLDKKSRPVPHLAISWKYSDDLKSLTITVRKGIKFHDGEDLNANVVKMNLDERKKGMIGSLMNSIGTIDIVDEYTVRLNLNEYKFGLLESFARKAGLMISPKVLEKAKTKKGKKWAQKNAVGTGPFKFVRYERDVILEFDRFDGYWQKGKPYLDGIEIHFIKDPMTLVTSFRAGEINMIRSVENKHAAELKKDGYKVISFPGGMRALTFDTGNPESILKDQRIREAIEYAIDKKGITDTLGYGFWHAADQYSPKESNSYIPGYKARPYNPEKAKKLLAEAGYPNGFKTRIIAASRAVGMDIMATIQRDLQNVGIDMKPDMADAGRYSFTQVKGWKNGIMMYGQRTEINNTAQLGSLFMTGARRFPCLKRSPELDEILGKAQIEPDYETQKELLQKAVVMISDMAMAIPLWVWDSIIAMDDSVRDAGLVERNALQWTPADTWLSK